VKTRAPCAHDNAAPARYGTAAPPTGYRAQIRRSAIAGLEHSHLWHAALADKLCRLGRTSDAAGELHTAATLAPSQAEQRLLQGRLRTVRSELG
jgi:predicted RNA polymerase sigma factor